MKCNNSHIIFTHRCPVFTSLPSECHMQDNPKDPCCKQPACTPGPSGSISSIPVPTYGKGFTGYGLPQTPTIGTGTGTGTGGTGTGGTGTGGTGTGTGTGGTGTGGTPTGGTGTGTGTGGTGTGGTPTGGTGTGTGTGGTGTGGTPTGGTGSGSMHTFQPSVERKDFSIMRLVILQMRMRSHQVRSGSLCEASSSSIYYMLCVQTVSLRQI